MSRHHTRLRAWRWARVRRVVFERDGWRCVECGQAGRLECDHVTPLEREPGQDPYDPNGLQTLLPALSHRQDGTRKSTRADGRGSRMALASAIDA